ncbi:MAG TPA: Rieske (2Fe-2S) protein [Crenalkalicoccus sp.]|jgi:3-phenylpropionate/trans-cinnamate dioxygenase ferredoxin subunit|nr:Rieske (2Fe-2S) protein [Crenalkalicoccus sp.]
MSKHAVAAVSELPPGSRRLVHVKGRPIVVFNLSGEFFALINQCPHQGAGLCDGEITGLVTSDRPGEFHLSRAGEIIRCPWHGWEFDIRTGQSWCDPSRIKVRPYPAEVASGAKLVQGPYVAETVPVRVEEDYVVLEV